jgi:L-histidine Nalpha-methyltransferase
MSHISSYENSIDWIISAQYFTSDIERDVYKGLTAPQKNIPSVYFYDERGSQLFEQITTLPEYYPTRSEAEILHKHADEIATFSSSNSLLVELGSGSSIKTQYLIKAFLNRFKNLQYVPIDVSEAILNETALELSRTFPALNVDPVIARYEEGLEKIEDINKSKFIIWLGSSIGNFNKPEAAAFLRTLKSQFSSSDQLLLGIDLIKDKATLENAYNDSSGVTAEFNLNLLHRMNDELGADFDVANFRHIAVFNEQMGRVEMYLESLSDQIVFIEKLNLEITFAKNELLHTENSNKFTLEEIEYLATSAGFVLNKQWFDSNKRFSLNLLTLSYI